MQLFDYNVIASEFIKKYSLIWCAYEVYWLQH